MLRPEYLYKYKAIGTEKELGYMLDILESSRIHISKPEQLNDPMESNALSVSLGVCGASVYSYGGAIHPIVAEWQSKFKILSLSSVYDSTVMWAHYADVYSGCCLIYLTTETFADALPMIYTDSSFCIDGEEYSDKELSRIIKESLLFKDTSWSYENEWRIVRTCNSNFIKFKPHELKGVILGERMNNDYKDSIVDMCKRKEIPCFRTKVMKAKKLISFWPIEIKDELVPINHVFNYFEAKKRLGLGAEKEKEVFYLLNEKLLKNIENEQLYIDEYSVQEIEGYLMK